MLRRLSVLGAGAVSAALVVGSPLAANASDRSSSPHRSHGIVQDNFVSNIPGKAKIPDAKVINPWGISAGPNSSVWVSEQGSSTSTVIRGGVKGDPTVHEVQPAITIPGAMGPTGQVFNDTKGFVVPGTKDPARFIFAGVSGNVSAWNEDLKDTAVEVNHHTGASYTGITIIHARSGDELAAADAVGNKIDLYDSHFHLISTGKKFEDPRLPKGAAVFNVAEIDGSVFVTYANGDPYMPAATSSKTNGWVDQYRTDGTLVRRFATGGALDNPWALTLAPRGFGQFAGDLLIGNFTNGRINAYNPHSGRFLGALTDTKGKPISIAGLWGLVPGSTNAGGTDKIWFSAGPDNLQDGIIGTLSAE
jgi:uncharacterized protein (TIGR03118 family)